MWPFKGDITASEFSISKPFLSIEFVFWFWENQKGKLEIFGEACCSTTFEAAALAQYWGETAISSCCCFWNSQKWKTIKGFFLQFVFKTKSIPNSQIFLHLVASLSEFNLFGFTNRNTLDMNTLQTYSINILIKSSMISNLSKIKTSAIWTNEKIIFYKWSRKYKGCPTFATKKWSKRPAQSITVIVISQIPYRVKRVVCFCSKTI